VYRCDLFKNSWFILAYRKLISKVRNVLEAQSPRHKSRVAHPVVAPTAETITIRTDARQFESFLRSINRFTSLLDARRLKNDVVGEIRRTRMLLGKYLPTTSIVLSLNNAIANHENEDWINGEKTEDVVAFLDRLYTAKRKVEQRIVVLGGEDDSPGLEPVQAQKSLTDQGVVSRPRLTLRDVLRNPSSLSYFMEFMDRRRRSLLVQFWLTVESFKNPLESVESGSSGDEDEPIQDQSSLSNVKEDISMINDLYFSGSTLPPALSSISNKYVVIIRSFARGELSPSTATERRVRRSVMLAQRQVEHDMEHDFDDFERSELWFRVVEDMGHNGAGAWSQPSAPMPKATRVMSYSDLESSPMTTHKEVRVSPQFLPRSESTPLLSPLTHSPRSGSSRSGSSSPGNSPTGMSQPAGLRATPSNIDVLMAPVGDDSSEHSRAPLFGDPDDKQPQNADEAQRMEAIQAALTDIMAHEKQQKRKPAATENVDHIDDPDTTYDVRLTTGTGRRRGVFDDLDEDNDNEVEDEDEERREGTGNDVTGSFQLAAPGDLQLSYEIARLGNKISDLQSQDTMLDTLIKKADLTGDHQELRLLEKSKSSMSRELRELQFQRAQYQQQESANRLLSDRTKVTIVSSTVGEEDGKSVVRYLTQVQQLAQDGTFASGWVVARRYNEFLSMHNKLRERYVLVRNLDFPGKRLVTALSGSFVDTRRTALEKYMQVRWPHT
jgi:sorting nexin-25